MWRFPDTQKLAVDDLVQFVGAGRTGIVTPANLADVLPYIRVQRIPGSSDHLTDTGHLAVDVFDATYTAAENLAEQIRQYLCGMPPPIPQLDRVACTVAPGELPWSDGPPTIRRFGATYTVETRRHNT